MTDRGAYNGFTLSEFLIALGIVGVILAFVATFFSLQSRVSRDQQARSELQTAARNVGDLMAQDFQLVGSRAATSTDGTGAAANAIAANTTIAGLPCFATTTAACLDVDSNEQVLLGLTVYYLSSLWLTEPLADGNLDDQLSRACRRVEYRVRDALLLRSDVPCLPAAGAPNLETVEPFAYEVAAGIREIRIGFTCAGTGSGGRSVAHPDACFNGDGDDDPSFLRSVDLEIDLRSGRNADLVLTYGIAAPTPNLRPPFDLVTGD